MATTALGVSPDKDGNGVSALTHRHVIASLFHNTGVLDGLTVSGRSDLSYSVSAGVAVCERNGSDGKTLAYWPGGQTPAVEAGDPTYPRLDVVWVQANNIAEYDSDPDNFVHVGVTCGSPSSDPVEPDIPDGATRLMTFRLPAGAASTGSAVAQGSVDYAIMYGGSLGRLGENWWKCDMEGSPNKHKMFYEMPVTFTVPTDRLVELNFQVNFSSKGLDKTDSQWDVQFQMDNQDIPHAAVNFVSGWAWETHQFVFITQVSAGSHTARLRTWLEHGAAPVFHWSPKAGEAQPWIGRRFQVFDRGAVA